MRALRFEGFSHVFGAPKNWDETKNGKCFGLPLKLMPHGTHISVWEPTPEERDRIARGENVVLSCFTIQPPVMLTVAPIAGVPVDVSSTPSSSA